MAKGKPKPKRKVGRPEGTYAKRRFKDTNLGRFILLHEPILYKVICPNNDYGYAPEIFLIKKVIGCSDNPSFKTKRYEKYLKEYEVHKLHVKRPRPITTADKERHRELRLIRAMNYVKKHEKEIAARDEMVRQIIQNAINKAEGR
jgi:hypothetical protein